MGNYFSYDWRLSVLRIMFFVEHPHEGVNLPFLCVVNVKLGQGSIILQTLWLQYDNMACLLTHLSWQYWILLRLHSELLAIFGA